VLTFFATLLVNVLIGTVFYLVISLKIEKSASELHVKKIRKEMDDMIREFNMTADRNISLLENRITLMKRMMEKNGAAFDVQLDEKVELKTLASEKVYADMPAEPDVPAFADNRTEKSVLPASKDAAEVIGGVIAQGTEFIRSIGTGLKSAIQEVNTIKEMERAEKTKAAAKKKKSTFEIRVDDAAVSAGVNAAEPLYSAKGKVKPVIVHTEEELCAKFSAVTGRKEAYTLISSLVDDGYTVEDISRISGMPEGEISLVVNLHGR